MSRSCLAKCLQSTTHCHCKVLEPEPAANTVILCAFSKALIPQEEGFYSSTAELQLHQNYLLGSWFHSQVRDSLYICLKIRFVLMNAPPI